MSRLLAFLFTITILINNTRSERRSCNSSINSTCGPCIAFDTCNLQCHASANICANSELKCGTSNTCQINCQQPSSCTDSFRSAPSSNIITVNCDHSNACEGKTVNVGNNADLIINCNGIENIYDLSNDNPMYSLKGEFYDLSNDNKRHLTFCKLIRCGALCNNADFINDKVDIAANPTEAAIIKFSAGHISAMYRMLVPEYREQHNKLHEIPFNSKNKWQISVHELPNNMLLDGEIEDAPVSYKNPTISSSINPATNPTKSPNINPTVTPTDLQYLTIMTTTAAPIISYCLVSYSEYAYLFGYDTIVSSCIKYDMYREYGETFCIYSSFTFKYIIERTRFWHLICITWHWMFIWEILHDKLIVECHDCKHKMDPDPDSDSDSNSHSMPELVECDTCNGCDYDSDSNSHSMPQLLSIG